MLISRRSRKRSDVFRSRFRDGSGGDFPLRQYLRCRDDLFTGSIHLLVMIAFTIAMAAFGRTVDGLFRRHGADLEPWIHWVSLALVGLLVLFLVRRVVRRVVELRETWQEMGRLKAEMVHRPESGRDGIGGSGSGPPQRS